MYAFRCLGLAAVAVLALSLGATTGAEKAEKSKPSQFDVVKQLVGDWTGKAKHGDQEHDATISYKLTSGGSAVVETLGPGTEHEMVTIYHLDGNDLVLTHYCMLHNQPHMKAEHSGAANKLVFKFTGGSNIKSEKDVHMHNLTLEIVDADHIKATWSMYKDGKQAETTTFDVKRKK